MAIQPTKTFPKARASLWMRLLSMAACILLLVACGKQEPPAVHAAQKKPARTAPKVPAADPASDQLLSAVDHEISAEDARLDRQVDEILREHPRMNAQELMNVPEVNESLRSFLTQLSQRPELQNKINSSVAFAAEMKDLRGPKESLQFSMDLSGYNNERTRRLLSSLLSRNPDRVVDFFEKEVGEASAEFALDPGAPKSDNGISVEPKPAAP